MSRLPDDFFDQLARKYDSDRTLADFWRDEERDLRLLFPVVKGSA